MRYEFKLPDLAEGMVEGELVGWLVAAGDVLKPEQPVAEVMTDKATVVIPSPVAGKILELPHQPGDIVKVGATLFVLEADGDTPTQKKSGGHTLDQDDAPPPTPAAVTPAPAQATAAPAQDAAAPAPATSPAPPATSSPAPAAFVETPRGSKALAAPATRRQARDQGIDIGQVQGSGPGGRVTPEDLTRHQAPRPAAPAASPARPAAPTPTAAPAFVARGPAAGETDERQKIRGLRKAIYETMSRSRATAAHFTYVDEVDCENLFAAREKLAKVAEKRGVKLTYLAFIAKATLLAIPQFPKVNARVDDETMELLLKGHIHLGVAAATEPGLVVPVIKHAQRMSLLELGWHIQQLGERAKTNTLKPDELKGSTFTISSLGKLGGLLATPIINHPEVAILGVHQMQKRAAVLDDDTIVARRRMNLSLSFDHRVVDGHEGAAFAQAIKAYLEDPDLMLLETA